MGKRQKDMGKKMVSAMEGFSEGRGNAGLTMENSKTGAAMAHMEPTLRAVEADVAGAAARVARRAETRREERRVAQENPVGPTIPPDLETFRNRIMQRSSKYREFTDERRQATANKKHALKVDWLRGGQDRAGFDAWSGACQAEFDEIAAKDLMEAAATRAAQEEESEEEEHDAADDGELELEVQPGEGENTIALTMHEMD